MPYSMHEETNQGGEHKVAIFNKDKGKVVAHVSAGSKEAAVAKAKKVERLREFFKHKEGG